MKYYPVLIPTLNRYEHFKRCVESLARNTHADKTELIIGLDYPPSKKYEKGYKQIKEYIPSIVGFKKVTVFERKENYGAGRNYRDLQKYAFDYYDAVISTEDDNEFSPCFLDYMDKALEKYRDTKEVSSVSGFNQYYTDTSSIIFVNDNSAWGFGRWRDKYCPTIEDTKKILSSFINIIRIFHRYRILLPILFHMMKVRTLYGDAIWTCYNIIYNKYQVRPSLSLVRNWGHDGSGIHCGTTDKYINMRISSVTTFELPDIPIKRFKAVDKFVRYNQMPTNFFKRRKVELDILLHIPLNIINTI